MRVRPGACEVHIFGPARQHPILARQYCGCSKLEAPVSGVASDAGTCMLIVGRSGDRLRGITQPHWVALYGLLGNTRQHRFLARQYCYSKLDTLVSEVASDAGTCMLMVGRSGDLRGITRRHWVALYGPFGNTRMTPYDQNRKGAGRPVWADMALGGRFLLRRLTRTSRASEPTQQTASRYARRMQPERARTSAVARAPETGRAGRARRS